MFARRNTSLSITNYKFINKYSNGDKIVLEKIFFIYILENKRYFFPEKIR